MTSLDVNFCGPYRKVSAPLCGKEGDKYYGTDFDTARKISTLMRESIAKLPRFPALESAVGRIKHPLHFGWRRSWRLWAWSDKPEVGWRDNLRDFAFANFLVSTIPQAEAQPLKPWLFVMTSCAGLWILQRGIVFLDTPEIIRADDNGHLHCEGGPAFRFRDGAEYYFLHGVRVPKKYAYARPEEITLAEVLAERNAEVRMMLISRIGFTQLLGQVRHCTISEANGNRLLEFRVKGAQMVRALHLRWRDKTGDKETVLPVPHRRSYFGPDAPEDIDDCEQVRRWTLGWPKEALAIAET